MTPFIRKVQEDSSGTVNTVGHVTENQAEHNPGWMLNRDEPPVLRRPVDQSQSQGYHPHAQGQNPMGSHPAGTGAVPYHERAPQPLNPVYQTPPQTLHAGAAQANFGGASVPPSYSNSSHSNDQIRQMGFLQDNFREDAREKGTLDEDDWNDRQSPLNFVILASLVILLTVLGWFTFRWMTTSYSGEPPVITAEDAPFKVKPENPGGILVPHQDKLVYGRLAPENQQAVEHLLPQPEQPIALPQMEQPQYYGNYPGQENAQAGYAPQPHDPSSQYPNGQGMPYPNHPANPQGLAIGVPQNPSQSNVPITTQNPYSGPQGQYPSAGNPQHPMAYPTYPQGPQNQGYANQANQPYPSQQQQPQGSNLGNYASPGQPYGVNQVPPPVGMSPQHSSPVYANQGAAPVMNPQGTQAPQKQVQAEGQIAALPQAMNVAPHEGIDDEISEEDMKAQEALDTLVADEIAGKAPPKVNGKDLKASSQKVDVAASGAYRLQVASFPTENEAKNEVKRLRSLDPSLFKERKFIIQKSESNSTKKVLYKVMIGFFESANATNQFKSKLKLHKVDGFVIKSKTENKAG